jgi:hypothetical protein
MDRSTPIYLITETWTRDAYGINQKTETERKVYADIRSVGMSEWFEGGRNGLNPELQMTMFFGDYQGEKIVKYNGIRYTVYRTYFARNDTIELYVERREGNV